MNTLFDIGVPKPRAEQPSGIFRTMIADPPWQPKDALPGPKRGAAKHYETMSTPDICALRYRLPVVTEDGLLFLWRLSSMPFDGLDVCRAWGFEPVSEIVWVKTTKRLPLSLGRLMNAIRGMVPRKVRILLGHYVRLSHEVCIIAARPGAAAQIKRHDIPSVFFAPLGRHSEKPAAFFRIVEALAPGPYVELFARAPRGPEWTSFGDELGTRLSLPMEGA